MESTAQLISRLKGIAESSPADAIDEALRLEVWTPNSPWNTEDMLIYCAGLAADVGECQLAGLAAYQAQQRSKQK